MDKLNYTSHELANRIGKLPKDFTKKDIVKFIKKNEKHLRPFLEQFKQTTLFQQYVNDLILECLQFPLPSQLK